MTHTYNAAVHDGTGFSPFFLMFGHHPNFAIYAFLGISQDTKTTKGHNDYNDRLKKSLDVAYAMVSR